MIEQYWNFLSTYFFNPFELPYPSYDIRKIFIENTIFEQQNKKKLQILDALHIRNIQPKLHGINFENSSNLLKCP